MDLNARVNNYCERIDPSFWSEPLNAITNIAFFIAAFVAYSAARKADRLEFLTAGMIVLALCVGTGSFLFHTFATRWAGLADTIPILLFILFYLYAATRRYFGAPVWLALLAPLLFVPFSIAFLRLWGVLLPGVSFSQGYIPVLIALLAYGAVLRTRAHPAAGWLFAAAGVFFVSLTFRSIDQPVCGSFATGTHFLWHILNGVLLGIVMLAFIRHGASGGAPLAMRTARG